MDSSESWETSDSFSVDSFGLCRVDFLGEVLCDESSTLGLGLSVPGVLTALILFDLVL